MQRYFIDTAYENQSIVRISGDDFHHMTRVMRMKLDDSVYVVFNNQISAIANLAEMEEHAVVCKIKQLEEVEKELPIDVTIASGLPKGDKLELVIQKGTELGAHQFLPFKASRSIVKWDEKKGAKKVERWNKIAKEAAEQSHRVVIPTVHEPVSFKQLLQLSKQYDYTIVAYEEAAKSGELSQLAATLQQANQGAKLLVVFGPEGGLSEQEVQQLEQERAILCGLGPRILRTETAPLYVLSAISYQFELVN